MASRDQNDKPPPRPLSDKKKPLPYKSLTLYNKKPEEKKVEEAEQVQSPPDGANGPKETELTFPQLAPRHQRRPPQKPKSRPTVTEVLRARADQSASNPASLSQPGRGPLAPPAQPGSAPRSQLVYEAGPTGPAPDRAGPATPAPIPTHNRPKPKRALVKKPKLDQYWRGTYGVKRNTNLPAFRDNHRFVQSVNDRFEDFLQGLARDGNTATHPVAPPLDSLFAPRAAAPAQPKIKWTEYGNMILAKYGWDGTKGIGAKKQGIDEPIVNLPLAFTTASAASNGSTTGGSLEDSRVVGIHGVLQGIDLDRDADQRETIYQRIGDTLAKHGNILQIKIHHSIVYVKFAARISVQSIHQTFVRGRLSFEGNQATNLHQYDEAKFDNNDFESANFPDA